MDLIANVILLEKMNLVAVVEQLAIIIRQRPAEKTPTPVFVLKVWASFSRTRRTPVQAQMKTPTPVFV